MDRPRDTLRAQLARALKTADVPDALWKLLDSEELVRLTLDGDYTVAGLAERARAYLRFHRDMPDRAVVRPRPRRRERRPSRYEAARARAFSAFVALQASGHGAALRFRAQYLGGNVLSRRDATRLLRSPAPRYLSKSQFERYGIPVVGHRSRILSQRERTLGPDTFHQVDMEVSWRPRCRRIPTRQMVRDPDRLAVPHMVESSGLITVWRGSVFFDLGLMAQALSPRYPWEPAEATWFILTGIAPVIEPVQSSVDVAYRSDHVHGRIALTVEPWVPATTVLREYRRRRRELLTHENRPMKVAGLEMFRYVTERLNARGKRPSWHDLMLDWNRRHPNRRYDDRRRFRRDYMRGERAVAFPRYAGPAAE